MSCTAAHQSKAEKQLCEACRDRKARFEYRGRVKADRDHTLCFQCYRAERDRYRAERLAGVKPAMLRAPIELTPRQIAQRRQMLRFAQGVNS
jgi:hypothetical protein